MSRNSLTQHISEPVGSERRAKGLKDLVGSGDRVILFTLPFIIVGLTLNILFPAWFRVGGPSKPLKVISIIALIPGLIGWLWSVGLILTKVPRRQLITNGPYAIAKHPLYTSVALLVLPWVGFLFNSWVGVVIGLALYAGSRWFSPEEEKKLSTVFGAAWDEYRQKVILPWL